MIRREHQSYIVLLLSINTKCSYKIINNKEDIEYFSEMISDYIDDENVEQIIYQNGFSVEDLLWSLIIEKKDKYIFFYTVSYD